MGIQIFQKKNVGKILFKWVLFCLLGLCSSFVCVSICIHKILESSYFIMNAHKQQSNYLLFPPFFGIFITSFKYRCQQEKKI